MGKVISIQITPEGEGSIGVGGAGQGRRRAGVGRRPLFLQDGHLLQKARCLPRGDLHRG